MEQNLDKENLAFPSEIKVKITNRIYKMTPEPNVACYFTLFFFVFFFF